MRDGHDGTWVAHPALVPVARAIFDAGMRQHNQVHSPLAPAFCVFVVGWAQRPLSWPSQMVNAANLTLCSLL